MIAKKIVQNGWSRFICLIKQMKRGALLGMLLSVVACSTYNPKGPGDTSVLLAPAGITIRLGAGTIELTWQFAGDTTQVKEYRVYRRSANEAAFRRIAAVNTRRYRDLSLSVGAAYQYQIAAVNKSNVEGDHSETVTVTPAAFSLLINNGAKFTNRRVVQLVFNAPANTALMQLSNDPAFTGASWEAFTDTKTWELTSGDGSKTVYAKFRTSADAESEAVSAAITLDTIASIVSVTHDGAGRVLQPGDILHIRLNAGEALGNALVNLQDNANGSTAQDNNVRLFDNGSNGDTVRDDGVYELDYIVRPELEFVGAFVYGIFTDAAGNAAPVRVSNNSFTAQRPPTAVRLSNPVPDSSALKLSWTASNEKDFASYRLYRATAAPVDSSGAPLTIINSSGVTNFRDTGATPNLTYFYRVFVFDRYGFATGSNTVNGVLKK